MAQVNLSPLAVEIPEALAVSFDQACDDLARASGSTRALLDVCIAEGVTLAFMGRAGKDATPEHRHGAALWSRLCIRKAAMMLGVNEAAFEPVYSGAVAPGDAVEIGRVEIRGPGGEVVGYTAGEVKTVTAWKGYVANAGRPIKTAMERLVRDDLAAAKLELGYAEKARTDAKAEAEKAEAALASVKLTAAKAEAEAVKAEAEAENAEAAKGERAKFTKAQAKAKAAKLRAKADSLAGEAAAVFDAAEDAAEYERAAMAEVKAEATRVAALMAQLPTSGRGASTPKTDADKWASRLDALLRDVRATTSPTGELDAVALVEALVAARAAITVAAVTE
jgi:hypothetical protein